MQTSAVSPTAATEAITVHGTSCRFCSSFSQNNDHPLQRRPWDTVLAASPNFVVIPTLGALVEGWLLIVPRRHYLCVGAFPGSLLQELKELLKAQVSTISSLYQNPTIFEHGPAQEGSISGCGVSHAHLHLVPLPFSLKDLIENQHPALAAQSKPVSGVEGVPSLFFKNKKDYLFLSEPDRQAVIYFPRTSESQFFRRLIATKIGRTEEYDYTSFPFTGNVMRTVCTIRSAARENK